MAPVSTYPLPVGYGVLGPSGYPVGMAFVSYAGFTSLLLPNLEQSGNTEFLQREALRVGVYAASRAIKET